MKIAVITDDSQTISAHFGRAQYYEVFTIQDGQVVNRETRPKANHNQFGGEHHHENHGSQHGTDPASEHRHGMMIEPISDCQVVLVRGMGMGAYNSLTSSGIHPIVTDVPNIENAVNAYLAGTLTDHPERLH
ncbi:MAG: dinitrogenase iron-molybdenum cofactor biosynthesis protein [Chloroflexi bacterium]|nr:MAG: dinitrogenase iron-molybdenum cofactor biosynthesis protein [Chloroflexota bacterium]